MFTYNVIQSMLVNSTDVWVMLPEEGKQLLTLSACRPIGTAEKRWINRAQLVSQTALDYEVAPQAPADTGTSSTKKATNKQTPAPQAIISNITYVPSNISQYTPQQGSNDPVAQIASNLALIVVKVILGQ